MTREQAIIRLRRISNSLNKYCDVNDCICGNCAKCYDALDMAEKALEQEPKHGKWIKGQLYPNNIYGNYHAECTNCGKVRIIDNFCPNCGARMESEGE